MKSTTNIAKKPGTHPHSGTPQGFSIFNKENYKWMLIGAAIIILGLILMAGGDSKDPNVFDPSEIYSFRRITLAPILIVAGLAIEVYAIMKKSKS